MEENKMFKNKKSIKEVKLEKAVRSFKRYGIRFIQDEKQLPRKNTLNIRISDTVKGIKPVDSILFCEMSGSTLIRLHEKFISYGLFGKVILYEIMDAIRNMRQLSKTVLVYNNEIKPEDIAFHMIMWIDVLMKQHKISHKGMSNRKFCKYVYKTFNGISGISCIINDIINDTTKAFQQKPYTEHYPRFRKCLTCKFCDIFDDERLCMENCFTTVISEDLTVRDINKKYENIIKKDGKLISNGIPVEVSECKMYIPCVNDLK